jgi:UDP-glucose 4-epimerase
LILKSYLKLNRQILLTGVSSFTGCWFAKILQEAGYKLVCPLPREKKCYTDLKKQRLKFLPPGIEVIFNSPFGSNNFLQILDRKFDLLCLHGSYVLNYGKDTFRFSEAISQNLFRVEDVLRKVIESEVQGLIWTSSIFENAIKTDNRNADVPAWFKYALSKKMCGMSLEHLCWEKNIKFGRFVISNPFGPLQDMKIAHFLAKSFIEKQTFEVKTPDYIRDLIHVRHLASAYRKMIDSFFTKDPLVFFDPCEYVGSLLEFANLFFSEFSKRLGYSCRVNSRNMDFTEPHVLTNKTDLSSMIDNYDPRFCWDELVNYYE